MMVPGEGPLDPETCSKEEYELYFKEGVPMSQRFPQKGAARWKKVMSVYGKLPHATLKVLKKKIGRDGYELLLVRDVNTNRRQDTVVKVYSKNILAKGVHIHCRGQPIALETETSDSNGVYEMLAGATMCEAIEVDAVFTAVFITQYRCLHS